MVATSPDVVARSGEHLMNRSLKLPLLIALALGSSHVMAMDLGRIQVKSALGQPLLAEIPVQQATPAELQQLSVRLASGDASSGGSSIPLHIAVVDGGKLIRITSDTAVNDPFLDLLVESRKHVHEFTILLDPPGSSAAPQLSSGRTTPHAARMAPVPQRSAGNSGSQAVNGQWTVERGQNLSTVARQTAPAGVDLNQMLLALKQANPDAFYRDNINALKAGAVLRIPDKAEAEAIAVAAAEEEVRRQNGDWRNGTVGNAPTTVADAGTRAGTSSSPTASGPRGDHLALLPAKQGGKSSNDGSNALHQDLQRSQETLASLQQQDADLKSRLKDLTDINSNNQRLLALKDNEIAELQQKLAAARKAAGMPVEPVAAPAAAALAAAKPAEKPASASTAATHPGAAAASTSAKPTAAPVTASSAPAASKPASAAVPAKAAPVRHAIVKPAPASDEPWYSQLWAQVLGATIIILLVLLGLLRNRRGKAAKPAVAPSKLASSLADRFEHPAPPLGSTGDTELDSLLDQLAEHPDDVGLHLELVSLYYDRRDVEHFEAAAEAMQAHISDTHQDEWQEVMHMGEELAPSHPLFARHDGQPADEADAHHGFDIDRYAAEPVSASAPEPVAPPPMPAAPVKVSEYSYNFDLTPPQEAAAIDDVKPAGHEHAVDEDATVMKSNWHFDEPEAELQPASHDIEPHDFNDDPVDTKLDLARAYIDMGDPEGARAMLEEVLHEGSQVQRDVARRLLDDLH